MYVCVASISMSFNTFIDSCKYHHYQDIEQFHHLGNSLMLSLWVSKFYFKALNLIKITRERLNSIAKLKKITCVQYLKVMVIQDWITSTGWGQSLTIPSSKWVLRLSSQASWLSSPFLLRRARVTELMGHVSLWTAFSVGGKCQFLGLSEIKGS